LHLPWGISLARLIALYARPVDPAAFDAYYFGTHVPLAKSMPGLRRHEVNQGPIQTLGGPSAHYLIATLHFDSLADLQAAIGSKQGQATAADVANYAGAGVELLIFDERAV
jgi:uncharacterized protein (TIGR02118 family)